MKKQSSYPKSLAETSDLIYGSFKNESSPSADDGTEIVAEQLQDLYYPIYQVLQLAGMEPNGQLENCTTSRQFITALANIAPLIYDDSLIYKKNSITINIFNNEIYIYQSKKDNNTSSLSDTASWNLILKINSSGVFNNITINSLKLTGTPTAPTAQTGTSNTQIATTAFVMNQIISVFSKSFYINLEINNGNCIFEFFNDINKKNRTFMIQLGTAIGFNTVPFHKKYNSIIGVFAQVITAESCVSAAIQNITNTSFYITDGTHGGRHEDRGGLTNYWIAFGT